MNCVDGTGRACPNAAEWRLISPTGAVPGSRMCRQHAAECVAEYRDKLGECWIMVPLGEPPEPIELGDVVRVRDDHLGPNDDRYAGRQGMYLGETRNGYARLHLDDTGLADSVLVHRESIEPVYSH